MLSTPFSAPLRLKPRFSRHFALLLGVMYSGAMLLPWLSSLPLQVKLPCTLLCAAHALFSVQRHLLYRHPHLPRELVLLDNVVLLDDEYEAELLPDIFAHPLLAVLHLKLPAGGRAVRILFADSLDADTFRRLRVRLRYPVSGEDTPFIT